MTFESLFKALAKSEKKIRISLTNEEMLILIAELHKAEKDRLQFDEFKNVYPESELKVDREYVAKKEKQFVEADLKSSNEGRFYGQVLELLITELGNSWLPGEVFKSSKFDDYKNAIDVFWEMEDDNGVIFRAGLDATLDEREIKNKLDEILDEYAVGKFHGTKYFRSELGQTQGRLTSPRFIVVADRYEIAELARLYIREKNAASKEVRSSLRNQIANHLFGSRLAGELLQQINGAITLILANASPYSPEAAGEKIYYLEGIKNAIETFGKNKKTSQAGAEIRESRTYAILQQLLDDGIRARS